MSQYRDKLKALINKCGVDVTRVSNSPRLTLCGMLGRPVHTVIDVGANSGQFSKYITGFYPDAAIYCFEPLPGPFSELQEWATTRAGKVHLYNVAVGDKPGMVEINYHKDHSPSSSILKTTSLVETCYPQTRDQARLVVSVETLDDALSTNIQSLRNQIMVKLDVQGYEDKVIRGAKQILSKTDLVVVEVSLDDFYVGQADFTGIVNMLHELDFKYAGNLSQSYASDGHVMFIDAVFKKF
ncbi:MAG: FkbM family methyltransferase [Thiogranum sp.]|nr:FkbM family methyltransferase [Thiogranum sp.]